MALVQWQPFREISDIQQEMNRLFNDVLAPDSNRRNRGVSSFTPAAEIEETENNYHLRLEVPGMKAEDLNIEVTADAVSIRGERKSETKTEENGISRSEFRYGQFQRVIPLPGRINHQNVEAEHKDGIIKLTLPKAEEERNKVVKVNLS